MTLWLRLVDFVNDLHDQVLFFLMILNNYMNTIFFIHKNTLNRKPFFLKKKIRKDIWENQMGKHISNSQFTHKKYSYINYLKICHILVCLS